MSQRNRRALVSRTHPATQSDTTTPAGTHSPSPEQINRCTRHHSGQHETLPDKRVSGLSRRRSRVRVSSLPLVVRLADAFFGVAQARLYPALIPQSDRSPR